MDVVPGGLQFVRGLGGVRRDSALEGVGRPDYRDLHSAASSKAASSIG
jgi:hypothetical protein